MCVSVSLVDVILLTVILSYLIISSPHPFKAAFSTALQCIDLLSDETTPQWVCLKVRTCTCVVLAVTWILTYVCTCVCTSVCRCENACTCAFLSRVQVHVFVLIYMSLYLHSHTQTHTHTLTLPLSHSLSHTHTQVIKNSKDFFDQSLDEIKLLQYINAHGDPDEHYVLKLIDFFYCKEHLFIVSELLRYVLYVHFVCICVCMYTYVRTDMRVCVRCSVCVQCMM